MQVEGASGIPVVSSVQFAFLRLADWKGRRYSRLESLRYAPGVGFFTLQGLSLRTFDHALQRETPHHCRTR
jgi:hypothetical protein